MLKPVATPHPAIWFSQIALTAGLLFYVWHTMLRLDGPKLYVGILCLLVLSPVAVKSRNKRAKQIDERYARRVER